VFTYTTSIDCRVNVKHAHTGLDAAIDEISTYSVKLIRDTRVLRNTILFGLWFTPLDQASVLPPLRRGTGCPLVESAPGLIRNRRGQVLGVDTDLVRGRHNSLSQFRRRLFSL